METTVAASSKASSTGEAASDPFGNEIEMRSTTSRPPAKGLTSVAPNSTAMIGSLPGIAATVLP
jgi:hypothetical protein